ncbi:adrenomedullin a isoform X1 [Syngnathus typhle]|uniref:adrenomedullin a isoform X1 n=1 Tax=Syngnathus typhle TaxID=161592 RepID=UPI002A6AEFDB|nr:adrenomedullin a isoform X1 [Syngnathus typhle]
MKLIFQAFLSCCLVATAAHCAQPEVNPKLKKRLSIWLGSRLRRDLESKTANSEHIVRQEDIRDTMLPHSRYVPSSKAIICHLNASVPETSIWTQPPSLLSSSTEPHVRTKRSKNSANQSRRQGCYLGTCSVHDLAHRLHTLNNTLRFGTAPPIKISPQGYGRRRRSLPDHRVALRMEQGRLRPVWRTTASQVHKLEALLRQT